LTPSSTKQHLITKLLKNKHNNPNPK
jgi:hypothetical protein